MAEKACHVFGSTTQVGLTQALGGSMKYSDGTEIKPGDLMQIDSIYRGRVVASMDTNEYLPGEDGWSYLGVGIMVDTDFAGLVHYTSETADDFVLMQRGAAA